MPPSAISDRKRWPSLTRYDRTKLQSLATRSERDAGGHMPRVNARGPSSSPPGPADFHEPAPRLQSTRAATRPSERNSSVYFAGSAGVRILSSLPRNWTSRHAVPPRSVESVRTGAWAETPLAASNRIAARSLKTLEVFTSHLPNKRGADFVGASDDVPLNSCATCPRERPAETRRVLAPHRFEPGATPIAPASPSKLYQAPRR